MEFAPGGSTRLPTPPRIHRGTRTRLTARRLTASMPVSRAPCRILWRGALARLLSLTPHRPRSDSIHPPHRDRHRRPKHLHGAPSPCAPRLPRDAVGSFFTSHIRGARTGGPGGSYGGVWPRYGPLQPVFTEKPGVYFWQTSGGHHIGAHRFYWFGWQGICPGDMYEPPRSDEPAAVARTLDVTAQGKAIPALVQRPSPRVGFMK